MSNDQLTVCLDTSTFINLEKDPDPRRFKQLCEWKKQGLIRMPMNAYGVFYELFHDTNSSSKKRFEILNELCGLDVIAINCADKTIPDPKVYECVSSNGIFEVISGKEISMSHPSPKLFRSAVSNSQILEKESKTHEELVRKMKILYSIMITRLKHDVNFTDFHLSKNFKYIEKIDDNLAEFLISWAKNKEFMSENEVLDEKFIDEYHKCLSNLINFSSFLILTHSSGSVIDGHKKKAHKLIVEDFFKRFRHLHKKYGSVQEAINRCDKATMEQNYGRELFQWIYLKHMHKRYETIAIGEYKKCQVTPPEFPEWILQGLSIENSVKPKKMPKPNDVWDFMHLTSLRDVDVITVDTMFYNMLRDTDIDKSILNTKIIKSHELDKLLEFIRDWIESK